MYSNLQLAKKYLHYYFHALNGKGHGMHSPFVYDMIIHVLNAKTDHQVVTSVESLRKAMLKDHKEIEVEDFGAGSRTSSTNKRQVRSIARSALKPEKFGRLFYRLVNYYKPQTILELGTSLGITTSYMALANPDARIITIEGSKAIASMAKANFDRLGIKNIEQKIGRFEDLLHPVLNDLNPLIMAYVDGNHLYRPTINYFHELLNAVSDQSILIFDDIHWSEEMEQAWSYIQQHEAVRTTIDLFFIGIVLLRPEFKEKQHFTVRF